MKRSILRLTRWRIAFGAVALPALLVICSGTYYEARGEKFCAHCHEMDRPIAAWSGSTHRDTACRSCHGGLLTLDLSFHLTNAHRLVTHLRGEVPEEIRIPQENFPAVIERCGSCHREERARWEGGPHGVRYREVFLDEKHNREEPLIDDCLRCHGMYFQGGLRDLVEPVDARGPWRIKPAGTADLPAIPCMACHEVHRPGEPLARGTAALATALSPPPPAAPAAAVPSRPREDLRPAGPAQEVHRPSLAFFDRRAGLHIPVERLPIPPMLDGERPVIMSPDRRQALCFQCHAALAGFQVGSGDDRTPVGVHEGLSCLACHSPHSESTRASCAGCHPRLSNCGLDVEAMDTSFKSKGSGHDVHFVKCADCHPGGVPPRKPKGTS